MHEDRIDLFTADEVKRAKKLMRETATPHARIRDDIITEEVMTRIDRETGQPNNRGYVAYRLEYIASQH